MVRMDCVCMLFRLIFLISILYLLETGDSTKSEPTEASSESDFDPNGSYHKGESSRRRCERQKQSGLKFAALAYESSFDEGEHKSAFLPYRVITNLISTSI